MSHLSLRIVYKGGSGCKCSGALTREQCYSSAVADLRKLGVGEDEAHRYATLFANTSEVLKLNINGDVFVCKPIPCHT